MNWIKKCIICIDEMSVKCNLFYNFGTDTVIGLHDDGTTKTLSPATSVATIKVKGITSNWKQPMGYFFSKTNMTATQIKDVLEKFI
jgi:hypothetical protein